MRYPARLLPISAGASLIIAAVAFGPVTASEATASPDVLNYAQHFGVSVAEAERNLDLQIEAGRLDYELSQTGTDWYAGLWISHDPSWNVVVATVDPKNPELRDALARSSLTALVQLRTAKVTLQDLLTDATRLRTVGQGQYRVKVDVRANQLIVGTRNTMDAATLIDQAGLDLVANVVFEEDTDYVVAATDLYAGRQLRKTSDNLLTCTSGFSVIDGLLQGYVTTAAHCPNNLTFQGGVVLTYDGAVYGGEFDHQLHHNFAHTVRNWTYDGITYPNYRRNITGKIHRNNQPLGATYCKYGISTYHDCGEVVDRFAECDIPSPAFHCIRLERFGVDMATPGDSGGPVFISGNAVGMIQACISPDPECDVPSETNPMVYIASNYIEQGLGVTIKTSP